MSDLTILFITSSEMPEHWEKYHKDILLKAAGDFPIICVSRKPTEGYTLNLIDEEPKSLSNIYRQMLRAAKIATTDYVAIAESDALYHKEHFTFYRPPLDTFCYDQNRWALFVWQPIFSWRDRVSNCSLIAPRLLLIEALEERFAKYPNGTPDNITGEVGRGRVERNMGITVRNVVHKFCEYSIIQVNHDNSSEDRQRTHRKKLGQMKCYNIDHWGEAQKIVDIYNQKHA